MATVSLVADLSLSGFCRADVFSDINVPA
jgi:hypothetical protein